jgi:hypothetical protein
MKDQLPGLSPEDLQAQAVTMLPDKEVVSLLDLNIDLDIAIDLAAPIDLAVAANANVAAPIDAAVSADLLSIDSTAESLASQNGVIVQELDADAIATAPQDADIDQSNDVPDTGNDDPDTGDADEPADPGGAQAVNTLAAPAPAAAVPGAVDDVTGAVPGAVDDVTGAVPGVVDDVTGTVGGVTDDLGNVVDGVTSGGLLDGNLLNVDVNVALDSDLAAPIAGAVAANANVAAPVDAAVAANIGTIGSEATAIADQTVGISQSLTGTAEATADQNATIDQ